MTGNIYIRAIVKDDKNCLALFDSNHKGDINDLRTVVHAGDTVIWKLDCCSGIKSLARIYSNEEKHMVFLNQPRKRLLCKGFMLRLDLPEAKVLREEKYTIECILCDDTTLIVDPFIRVPPPPPVRP